MIYVEKENKVYFIDFGLGFESKKAEDKAVDLHLIKQALEAKHFNHFERFFQAVLEGYKSSKHHIATLARLKAVEKRGRYKQAG
jgi:Kae1-associated kinase Bud32